MLISKIPGSIGADARHRINLREETERALVNAPTTKKPTEVSAPKAPMASTVNSPSAISTTAPEAPPAVPGKSIESVDSGVTGIEKPAMTTDINNLLGYQSSLLEQILVSTNNLVSVNQDILRYARTQ